jgi:4-amino-4-deoxy-L-arabinose transferase-like glycosyltransferase
MPLLQDSIHKLEEGGGLRYFRIALAVLAVLFLAVVYDNRDFTNFSTPEAMDSAQLARNISEGNGYTTLFVRPFSMYLVKKANEARFGEAEALKRGDSAQIKGMHPDISNPPAYPALLAGLMKVLPFDFEANSTKPFWSLGGKFRRFQPDFFIAAFNELLFLALIVAVFFLARRLFDGSVAWLTAFLLLGTEIFWRYCVSGLSTVLLMLMFVGLAWALVLLEEELREPKWGQAGVFVLTGAGGLIVGLGGLTRYSFGWLILPVVFFVVLHSTGARRVYLPLLALVVFAAVMSPWLIRNEHVSGTPFGTAGYSVMEDTVFFPGDRLPRSLEPDFARVTSIGPFWQKLLINARQIFQNELPRLGGTWMVALFATGLLVNFRSLSLRRLRAFLLASMALLFVVEALGRTELWTRSPDINSENLLILVLPLIIMYGTSLFFLLLDQIELSIPEMRYGVIGALYIVTCLPMILAFLPPRGTPISYPYLPPVIQTIGGWMKPDELIMSDIPWGVAWYGHRQSVWITLNATRDPHDPDSRETIFNINDNDKQVKGLYLTAETIDSRFLTDWIHAGELSWGSFILDFVNLKVAPPDFPIREAPSGFMPEQLFLADWKRWRQ